MRFSNINNEKHIQRRLDIHDKWLDYISDKIHSSGYYDEDFIDYFRFSVDNLGYNII